MMSIKLDIPANLGTAVANVFRERLNRIDPVDVARAGAEPIVNQAKENAPWKTGTLCGSIGIYDDIQPSVRSRVAWTGSVRIGTGKGVDYAYWQEFGSSRMKGKFYLTRAYAQKKGEARRKVLEMIRGQL